MRGTPLDFDSDSDAVRVANYLMDWVAATASEPVPNADPLSLPVEDLIEDLLMSCDPSPELTEAMKRFETTKKEV